jgi:hypothetical protein
MTARWSSAALLLACVGLLPAALPVLIDLFSRRRQFVEEPEPQSAPAE